MHIMLAAMLNCISIVLGTVKLTYDLDLPNIFQILVVGCRRKLPAAFTKLLKFRYQNR